MTAGDMVAQIQAVMNRGHGEQTRLYFVDTETGQRYDLQVVAGIDAVGVYVGLELVVPTPVGR